MSHLFVSSSTARPRPDRAVPAALAPLHLVGRITLASLTDLGRMVQLVGDAIWSVLRPRAEVPPFWPSVSRRLSGLLLMGFPLVAVVHFGLGSFLSLQAYFGGTFVDGTGAVVGVGLLRNVAPMMSGLIMAALIAARVTPELRRRPWAELDGDPLWIADRDAAPAVQVRLQTRSAPSRSAPEPGRLAAVRITSAVIAGPIMAVWGALVGTVVGWQTAKTMLGVSTHTFFDMFWEMLWRRDITGMFVKGAIYALVAGLMACHEGLRRGDPGATEATAMSGAEHDAVAWATFRAVFLASVVIMVLNSGWFLVVYHAGSAFGPTLMEPQG